MLAVQECKSRWVGCTLIYQIAHTVDGEMIVETCWILASQTDFEAASFGGLSIIEHQQWHHSFSFLGSLGSPGRLVFMDTRAFLSDLDGWKHGRDPFVAGTKYLTPQSQEIH